ncbi:MAG: cytidine deaminase [Nocardioidaceae bacterium]
MPTAAPAPANPEDAKLITLARATRSRTGAAEGAAVRDRTGRTYTAATVELSSLRLSALQLAVAMAVSSGADGLEAAALVSEALEPTAPDAAVLRDLAGAEVALLLADPDGAPRPAART